jgi:hypothetical protein
MPRAAGDVPQSRPMRTIALPVAAGIALAVSIPRVGAGPTPPLEPDIPAQLTPRGPAADFERRDVFQAKPGDYRKATHRVYRRGAAASYIELPIAP